MWNDSMKISIFSTIRTEIFFSYDKNLSLCHRDVSIFQMHSTSWQAFEFMLASLRFAQWIFIIQDDWMIISFLRMTVTPWTPNKPNSLFRFWWLLFLFDVRFLMIFTVWASIRIRLQNGEKFRNSTEIDVEFHKTESISTWYAKPQTFTSATSSHMKASRKKNTIDLKSIWFVCLFFVRERIVVIGHFWPQIFEEVERQCLDVE